MHKSVMLQECIENLSIKEDSVIVDCTLGYGGHSSQILEKLSKGHLYAFDQDAQAIIYANERLQTIRENYTIIESNFSNLKEELIKRDIRTVNGILYDLGVSSPQLDEDIRGFSFHNDSKLDMRMNQQQALSAFEVVNDYALEDLIRILRNYGEEKYAVSIAKGIVHNRPITTTLELTEIIKKNVPFSYRNEKHPARKTFQAIRIEVNKELDVLKSSLKQALDVIALNGRIVVLTFHSLEDRIVKNIFKEVSSVDEIFKNMPMIPDEYQPKFKIIGTYKPSKNEIEQNRRSRSVTLRVIERVR